MSEGNGTSLPQGWAATSLAAIVEARSGKAKPQDMPHARFIGMEHVEAHTMRLLGTVSAGSMKSAANIFQAGDVLYGRLRSYLNKVYRPDFEGMCSGEFIVMPETSAVCGGFLKYRLNSGDFVRFASNINTGDRPRVDFDQIKVFSLFLPPRLEQERIADALDELFSDLDSGVAALLRVREELQLYRASVLKAAVEGALTADWRANHQPAEPANELLDRILAERRRRWEEDQLAKFKAKGQKPPRNWKAKYKEPVEPDVANLPPLPDNWGWGSTEQICEFITKGTTPSGTEAPQTNGEVPFIKVQHLSNTGGFHFEESPAFVSRVTHQGFLTRSIVFPGDVLMNIVGPPLGQVSMVPTSYPEWNVNQAIAIFRPIAAVRREYLSVCLLSRPVISQALRRTKTTAGQVNLTLEVCRDLAIPLPPVAEQEAIVEAVEDQLSVVDHLEADLDAQLSAAHGLRQAILRHAFSGKLVPQDPNDEPVSELFTRIAAEREERGRAAAASKRAARNNGAGSTRLKRRKTRTEKS